MDDKISLTLVKKDNPGVITEEDLMMIREAFCEYFFVYSEIKIIVACWKTNNEIAERLRRKPSLTDDNCKMSLDLRWYEHTDRVL